jgi:hypothetical protein
MNPETMYPMTIGTATLCDARKVLITQQEANMNTTRCGGGGGTGGGTANPKGAGEQKK